MLYWVMVSRRVQTLKGLAGRVVVHCNVTGSRNSVFSSWVPDCSWMVERHAGEVLFLRLRVVGYAGVVGACHVVGHRPGEQRDDADGGDADQRRGDQRLDHREAALASGRGAGSAGSHPRSLPFGLWPWRARKDAPRRKRHCKASTAMPVPAAAASGLAASSFDRSVVWLVRFDSGRQDSVGRHATFSNKNVAREEQARQGAAALAVVEADAAAVEGDDAMGERQAQADAAGAAGGEGVKEALAQLGRRSEEHTS